MPAHHLGPAVVGQRVVIRRLVRGESGPTGGPAMTDVLGVCTSWPDQPGGLVVVRREDGSEVSFPSADIVSGKPVPPRPSVRMRVDADEVERRAAQQLRPRETEFLGAWRLRHTGGTTGRSNSVLPLGDPGLPFDEAVARVEDWYSARDRSPLAQVVVGSPAHDGFTRLGWVPARPDEADASVQLASVARARRLLGPAGVEVERRNTVDSDWLVGVSAALADPEAAAYQLGTGDVVFAAIRENGVVVARGRGTYDDDWLGVTDLWVDPGHRRTGLARAILADVLEWGAERGATTALLQVLSDNTAAIGLYERAGFVEHHRYRYLTTPG